MRAGACKERHKKKRKKVMSKMSNPPKNMIFLIPIVTHRNESRHTYEWDRLHTRVHRVTNTNESRHTYEQLSHVTHVNNGVTSNILTTESRHWQVFSMDRFLGRDLPAYSGAFKKVCAREHTKCTCVLQLLWKSGKHVFIECCLAIFNSFLLW